MAAVQDRQRLDGVRHSAEVPGQAYVYSSESVFQRRLAAGRTECGDRERQKEAVSDIPCRQSFWLSQARCSALQSGFTHSQTARSKHPMPTSSDSRLGETARAGHIDRIYETSAKRLRQHGHSPSYPLTSAVNADGCGMVIIALNANGARCA